MPITQVELAEAIGISTVHVSRFPQALRAKGLIQTKGMRVTIPDPERLKEVGDFDPLYLHLQHDEAA
jgi:DNA-binding transcriptional regulator LsrR (DeoR family)